MLFRLWWWWWCLVIFMAIQFCKHISDLGSVEKIIVTGHPIMIILKPEAKTGLSWTDPDVHRNKWRSYKIYAYFTKVKEKIILVMWYLVLRILCKRRTLEDFESGSGLRHDDENQSMFKKNQKTSPTNLTRTCINKYANFINWTIFFTSGI